MKKCLILMACIFLGVTCNAAESFRLLLDDGHSENLVDYLESAGVEISRAEPFAKIENSEEVVKHLGAFAQLQQEVILEARMEFWSGSDRGSAEISKYQKKYYKLRDAKIRHRLALQALASCNPEFVGVEPSR